MAHPFSIYATSHAHSQRVCAALARGTGFPVVEPAPLRDGGMVTYGFLRGLLPTLTAAREARREWVYVDRGYFRVTYGTDYTGFFRVTRGAFQLDGLTEHRRMRSLNQTPDRKRWERLLLKLAPWRAGRHILVCPPGDIWASAMGFSASEWLRDTLGKLAAATDRPVRVRRKPKLGDVSPPLAFDLQDCHALVTHASNTAVEAILAGVPTFCTGECAGRYVGCDLEEIDDPIYFDRETWAANLANNQWTLDEIKAGLANEVFL